VTMIATVRVEETTFRSGGVDCAARVRTTSLGWLRVLAVFLGLAGVMLLICGQALADETGIEDNPPVLGASAVSPSGLPHEGGNVQLSAEVVDDFGVSMVYAQIYDPDGSTQLIQLIQGDHNTYYGTLEVPPNDSDSEVNYGVEVQAWDTNGAYIASLIGGVQVEAAPQFDEAPYVTEPRLTPAFLPATGGSTAISVEASDNRSISAVYALIASPGGSDTEVSLGPVDFDRYEGTFTAPANLGPLGAEYVVEIIAQDDIGQETRVSAGILTVEASQVPPSIGQLRTWPGTRRFGSVRLGRAARRFVFARNVPRTGGAPVEGTARIVGSPAFSLAGASSAGIHFALDSGKMQAFLVKFRPTTAGQQTASLEIVRDDGGQQGFAIALSGRGAKR
jgi:hypothetical protein